MTDDSHRFTPIAHAEGGGLPLHEGKTFHQFTDRWKAGPRYALLPPALADKPQWLRASGHYRLAFREIARSTDDRTMIAAVFPPGHVFGHKATCEKSPWARPNASALVLCAVFNSFAFDWCLRRRTAASVSLFLLNACPAPSLSKAAARFLAHGALRLSYRHAGYDVLWREQLGARPLKRPGLQDEAMLRAAMDAVVARAYGLDREEYRHVLGGFGHKGWPEAPEACLRAFDELAQGGAAFYRRHDPFREVALPDGNEWPSTATDRAGTPAVPRTGSNSAPRPRG